MNIGYGYRMLGFLRELRLNNTYISLSSPLGGGGVKSAHRQSSRILIKIHLCHSEALAEESLQQLRRSFAPLRMTKKLVILSGAKDLYRRLVYD